jgi:hypothetical protein
VIFIREIDLEKSERILAILSEKEVSRTCALNITISYHTLGLPDHRRHFPSLVNYCAQFDLNALDIP